MRSTRRFVQSIFWILALTQLCSVVTASNGLAPTLGGCQNFTLFGAAGVTTAGSGALSYGNVGSSNTPVTGPISVGSGFFIFGAGQLNAQPNTPYCAGQCDNDCNNIITSDSAYNQLSSQACTTLGSIELGGLTLAPGVYCTGATTFQLSSGTLTLAGYGAGNTTGVWVFQAMSTGTSLTVASNTQIVMSNGGLAQNVYWVLGGGADLSAGTSTFIGTIFAHTNVVIGTSVNFIGRAFGVTASVTLAGIDIITLPSLVAAPNASVSASQSASGVSAASSSSLSSSGVAAASSSPSSSISSSAPGSAVSSSSGVVIGSNTTSSSAIGSSAASSGGVGSNTTSSSAVGSSAASSGGVGSNATSSTAAGSITHSSSSLSSSGAAAGSSAHSSSISAPSSSGAAAGSSSQAASVVSSSGTVGTSSQASVVSASTGPGSSIQSTAGGLSSPVSISSSSSSANSTAAASSSSSSPDTTIPIVLGTVFGTFLLLVLLRAWYVSRQPPQNYSSV